LIKYNLEGKKFVPLSNSSAGEVGKGTVFEYHQDGDLVWADYSGGEIVSGHLIAKVLTDGSLDMRYHHVNKSGEIMLGKCVSTPEVLADGRLKFNENWQWLCGDHSTGYSEIVEVK